MWDIGKGPIDLFPLNVAAFGIYAVDGHRIAQQQFMKNDVGRMAVIGLGHTDYRNGGGLKQGVEI
jgi:hypothetical protein